jgi:hypothetical protein
MSVDKIEIKYDSVQDALQKFSNLTSKLGDSYSGIDSIVPDCQGRTKEKVIEFKNELKTLQDSLETLATKTQRIIERAGLEFPVAEEKSKGLLNKAIASLR